MTVKQFIKEVLLSCSEFPWIKKIEREQIDGRVRIRLFIDKNFVDVYYNEEKKVISYAYIENRKRIFGANNMRIGGHIHPFYNDKVHKKVKTITIEKFLNILEKHLKDQNKV